MSLATFFLAKTRQHSIVLNILEKENPGMLLIGKPKKPISLIKLITNLKKES